MALANYSDLQAAVADWCMGRTTTSLANTADIIKLAEARLNRELQVRKQETEAALTGVTSSRYIPVPAGFTAPINLYINISGSGRAGLDLVSPDMNTTTSAGQPQFWAIDSGNVAFERPCDQAYSFTLRYYCDWDLLADTTNWLLTNYPDSYLYASLSEAAHWLQEWDTQDRHEAKLLPILASINAAENRHLALAPLRTDAALLPYMRGRRGGYDINRDY